MAKPATMAPITWANCQVTLGELKPWADNPRLSSKRQAQRLLDSWRQFGQVQTVAIGPSNEVYDGHQRLSALLTVHGPSYQVDARRCSRELSDVERRALVVTLHAGAVGSWNWDNLANWDAGELQEWGFDSETLTTWQRDVGALGNLIGSEEADSADAMTPEQARQTLAEQFLIPPFSVLDARQGYWQQRKSAWIALGIKSELGRGVNALDMSATMAGITDEDERAACSTQRRESPGHGGTLGAIAPNEAGDNGIFTRTGKYASRKANATPGGSLRPAANLGPDGKTQRGDGKGRRINGKLPAAIGGQPLPLDRMANGKSPARKFGQDLMRGEHVVGENHLTWVAGTRDRDELDPTSRKILAAGRTLVSNTSSSDKAMEYAGGETASVPGTSGTSIFDPVLCELAYTWFCPPGGHVLDPFAGGSVRGIVASVLGRKYTGVDLRAEQVQANGEQAVAIVPDNHPVWIVGDSQTEQPDGPFDFVFSCPPYYNLEIYSDDPADLSNMEYGDFLKAYRIIIAQAVGRLADNRFACFVVGDVRDKAGLYRNFVSETIAAFQDAGAMLYNEAILVTAVGSLPIRVGKQFSSGRKLGKTHQNVLVFVKGDSRRATTACGPVKIADLDALQVAG